MGAHIREFRKVTTAVPNSGQAHMRLAGRSCQPKGMWLRGWLLLSWGVLLRGLLYNWSQEEASTPGRTGCGSKMRLKMVLCRADVSHPCNSQLSREHIAVLPVHKHTDACACFPQEGEPSLPGWVNVDHFWSIPENGSFCFCGSFLECGNTFVEFFYYYLDRKGVHTAACF